MSDEITAKADAYYGALQTGLEKWGMLHKRKTIPSICEYPESVAYVDRWGHRASPAAQNHLARVDAHPSALMSGSLEEANFLALLMKLVGAKKVVEVGTFLGLTTLVLAEALPEGGKIVTVDFSKEVQEIARAGWKDAGVADRIDARINFGTVELEKILKEEGENSFDFAFIDADKENYDAYYETCLKLVRKNGIVAVDNTIWFGKPARKLEDEQTKAISALNEKIHSDERVDISMVPFADGVTICRVK